MQTVRIRSALASARVRLHAPALYRDPARSRELEARLREQLEGAQVSCNSLTASVLVVGGQHSVDQIAMLVASLVGGRVDFASAERPPAARARSPQATRESRSPAITKLGARLIDQRPASAAGASHLLAQEARFPHHTLDVEAVVLRAGVDLALGLSDAEAASRLEISGPNAPDVAKPRSALARFFDQLTNVPVALLGGSAVISLATGGIADAIVIGCVVLLNATIGLAIEGQADRVLRSLLQHGPRRARALRGSVWREVDSATLVPGDLIDLRAGVIVPADARLVNANELRVDESALTGESMPVEKRPAAIADPAAPLSARSSMVFMGTVVTGGSGLALVVETGPRTQLGEIQTLAQNATQPATPLEQQLDQLGKHLVIVSASVCAAVMGIGLLRGHGLLQMLRTSVSLAVAAVPEGLPTVAITTLALGVRRLERRAVLARKPGAVEAIGAISVLCLDKTGTITVNRMTVQAVYTLCERLNAAELDEPPQAPSHALRWLLRIATLCSDVELRGEGRSLVLDGSPTETALIHLALGLGEDVIGCRDEMPRVSCRLRSDTRSFMETVHTLPDGRRLVAIKGRPAEVLAMCDRIALHDAEEPIDDAARMLIQLDNERLASDALRVLGLAYRFEAAEGTPAEEARDLVWLGLVGMADPAREGVAELLEKLHTAGIDTVMITGDQGATAESIARRIGLARNGHLEILDSTELERLPEEVLTSLAQRVQVFARVTPSHKLQIVRALQSAGRVVGMTGDGVNDGPALRAADVGIAMGGGGTDAAREVADIVLMQDDLETLVFAVEQGRVIYDDIRKAVRFILATNSSELMVTLATVAAGFGEVLTPMQLLWLNLMTDVLPELALAVEPPEQEVLLRPPRAAGQAIFDRSELGRMLLQGSVLSAVTLASYGYGVRRYGIGPHAGTIGFTTLSLAQLLHAIGARSEHHSVLDRGTLARNPAMAPTLLGSLALQTAAGVFPPLRRLLGATALSPFEWGFAVTGAGVAFLVNETLKVAMRSEPPRVG
jgi:P-type Ca2+ transporter type 2C